MNDFKNTSENATFVIQLPNTLFKAERYNIQIQKLEKFANENKLTTLIIRIYALSTVQKNYKNISKIISGNLNDNSYRI